MAHPACSPDPRQWRGSGHRFGAGDGVASKRYRIRKLYADYQCCGGDCPGQRFELDLRCCRGDASDALVGDDLLLHDQRGANAAVEAVDFGLWLAWLV
ncbi:MAG: hypothetical protein II007_15090 [Gammaproteobacteria bacterium]|nr:hypothetical protein [Gammaproteobacteria bacterium]